MSTPSNPLAGPSQQVPLSAQMQQMQQNASAPPSAAVTAPVTLPQQDPGVPAALQPQQPNVQEAHHSLLGKAFYAIANPQSGTGTPTQRLFKNILAGAMIGAANGGQSGSGWTAAANGGRADQYQQMQNAAIQQQQQQQQFENQMRQNKDQRQQQQLNSSEALRKAQTTMANAETLKTNQLAQGQSWQFHQDVANADKDRVSSYEASGLKPVYQDITESQMNDYLKNNPGASSLDWRHTGVKNVGTEEDPNYEFTLSAYDPKGKINVSDATVQQWDKDGLFKYHPEYKAVVESGKPLDYQAFSRLDQMAQTYYNQGLKKTADDLDTQAKQLKIKDIQSSINKHNAQAKKATVDANDREHSTKESDLLSKALGDLNAKGGDIDQVSPGSRIVIQKFSNQRIETLKDEYKSLSADAQAGDKGAQDEQKQILTDLSRWRSWGNPKVGTLQDTTSPLSNPIQKTMDYIQMKQLAPDAAADLINGSTELTAEQKKQAVAQLRQNQSQKAADTRQVLKGVVEQGVRNLLQ